MASGYDGLLEILSELRASISSSVSATNSPEHAFDYASTAALIKSYEFCIAAAESTSDRSYLLVASLRGICEDFISLKFIHEKKEGSKNQIVLLRSAEEAYASSVVQWAFFKENHPDQNLYYRENFSEKVELIRSELRTMLAGHKIKQGASMPSVFYMANSVGLASLYQYLYNATSQFVHCNPRLLLRLGWESESNFDFSTKHFGNYYKHFTEFYGTYLLIALFEWLATIDAVSIRDKAPAALTVLKKIFTGKERWPELVTFEEMNIGSLSRNLFYRAPSQLAENS